MFTHCRQTATAWYPFHLDDGDMDAGKEPSQHHRHKGVIAGRKGSWTGAKGALFQYSLSRIQGK